MQKEVMFSSNTVEWGTPVELFNRLNNRFKFTLDVCANDIAIAKVKDNFYNLEQNGLVQDWSNNICWMNPPYGKDIINWVKKAKEEADKGNCIIVGLLPVRIDTVWWNNYVQGCADIKYLKGRLQFEGASNSAPFPSCIAIWYGWNQGGFFNGA